MSDELTIEGKQFISSKRASESSGYTQDYIGQLARGGLIEAQRIGGLWYVYLDSLSQHKQKSDLSAPKPASRVYENQNPETLLSFEGRDYVSAAKAAEMTGYNQDYIGQLARANKVSSRQVGNRWYVDREALMAHKSEKDGLLGAVQVQSVGLAPVKSPIQIKEEFLEATPPFYTYGSTEKETGVLPVLKDRFAEKEQGDGEGEDEETPIPIRIRQERSQFFESETEFEEQDIDRGSKMPRYWPYIYKSAITLLLVGTALSGAFIARGKIFGLFERSAVLKIVVERAGDVLEPLVSRELNYIRK